MQHISPSQAQTKVLLSSESHKYISDNEEST